MPRALGSLGSTPPPNFFFCQKKKEGRGKKKLTLEAIKGIKIENIKNETIKLWIYKQINNKLVLINNNQPTFNSKYLAAKELKISHKTINKYLDTNKSYNDLFFYSKKL